MRSALFIIVLLLGVMMRRYSTADSVMEELIAYSDEYYHNISTVSHENRYLNLPYVEKHIFSNQTRFIFFAGLGGTGHHLIEQLIKGLNHTKEYADAPEIRNNLWNTKVRSDSLFTIHSKHGFKEAIKNVYQGFHSHNTLHNKIYDSTKLKPAVYFTLNCLASGRSGMLSYPNFFASQHNYEPNFNILAKVAECAGVDYRVVIMTRDPFNSIISVFKRFLKKSTYKQILQYIDLFALSQRHLLRQIASTDKSFYTCVEYEKFNHHAKSIEDRVFNLHASNWSFHKIAIEKYRPSNRTAVVELNKNFTKEGKKGGKENFPITYAQIQERIKSVMYDDYRSLLRVCEMLR